MEKHTQEVYFGLDINDKYTMISFYQMNMKEPETVSTVMGSEAYQIPTYLSKKKGIGQWYFGSSGKQQVALNQAVGVDALLSKALHKESVFLDQERYAARELLVIFLKKVLGIPSRLYANAPVARLTVCVERMSLEMMELFSMISARLGLSGDQLLLIDRREGFYYYALNQEPQIFLHDVALFDYSGTEMESCMLKRNLNTVPQVVTLDQDNHGSLLENRDQQFDRIITEVFAGRVVSGVYLIGDGFDGDWMKVSLQKLCRGRKVFVGKNLYSKGACYAGVIKDEKTDWPFVYIGDNELKLNLSLKVFDGNEMQFYTLINAGDSWYDSVGECEVILDGTPEMEIWLQRPESRQAYMEILELTDLPEREKRTTRLRITATPKSDREITVTIKDLGFGEIVPGSNKIWEHVMQLD